MAKVIIMKTYGNLWNLLCSDENLEHAFKKARKHKTQKPYVIKFEKNLNENLSILKTELLLHAYRPLPFQTFILRDPKTRKISKSEFRDRIVHHALIQVLEPIFDKIFIYDSCANRKGKGNLFAIKRFDEFKRKVSKNGKLVTNSISSNQIIGYCFKADIRHYFEEVDHETLLGMLGRKIRDKRVMWLINQILHNFNAKIDGKGMPLGNLTSQFFANVYLNELDYFVKHVLKAKYYIRYVDDFVILHNSKRQLEIWHGLINKYLKEVLKIELHPEKSKIISLANGVDFVGFRNFYHHKLLRKRNTRKMINQIERCKSNEISYDQLIESFQGWRAYAKHANAHKLARRISSNIQSNFANEVSRQEVNRLIQASKINFQ